MKLNKTVMLFKKGDSSKARSWPPITITPTLYRMLMCHISVSLQTWNNNRGFISENHKRFMRIPACSAVHSTVVDEMIHRINRKNKSLYITKINFMDEFGSMPHKPFNNNLMKLKFEKSFVDPSHSNTLNDLREDLTRLLLIIFLIYSINHTSSSYMGNSIDHIDAQFNDSFFFKADIHYNPMSAKDHQNPDWFIVTADPHLAKHTPLAHNNSNDVMDGVLVA